jgi:zinc/manganese transport system substrate-binding protein
MKSRSIAALVALAVVAVPALSGCSATASGHATAQVSVVASTNVYGDIARTVAGGAVKITSIMNDPAQDPHSFEASAQNQLAVSKADIVIENGGGYDDFMDSMLRSTKNTRAQVLNVVNISGKKPAKAGGLNEHVWYDFSTIASFTDRLVAALKTADPSRATTFTHNADAFRAQLATLQTREAQLKASYAGRGILVTEPVPLYLLEAIGLQNRTPQAFSSAIENGTDVSPAVLQQVLDLAHSGRVALLGYNEQTTGPQTVRVLAAAKSGGLPVVPFTETLPAGTHYIAWMRSNLDAVAKALAG